MWRGLLQIVFLIQLWTLTTGNVSQMYVHVIDIHVGLWLFTNYCFSLLDCVSDCVCFCLFCGAQVWLIKAAVVLATWKTVGRFSGTEDCMLPSPVILGSGYMVIVLAAVCLDSGPETHRCVWVSEYCCECVL